jgi:SAM-dependent methyltransferase
VSTDDPGDVGAKWKSAGSGAHYSTQRFRGARAAQRDPKLVDAILREHGVRGRVLDVPCGTGRLTDAIARHAARPVGADVSMPMLAQARADASLRLAQASAEHLPFADRAFDVVVCCRLLHHLRDAGRLERVVAELVRVSDRLVVASYWDAASLPALRVKWGLKRGEGERGRGARAQAEIERVFAAAGARCVEFRHSFRFVSQQTFVVAERAR